MKYVKKKEICCSVCDTPIRGKWWDRIDKKIYCIKHFKLAIKYDKTREQIKHNI